MTLYVVEGDPQWDFARAAGGLIMHTRPDSTIISKTTISSSSSVKTTDTKSMNTSFGTSSNGFHSEMYAAPLSLPKLIILRGVSALNKPSSGAWGGDSGSQFCKTCDVPGIVARPAVHCTPSASSSQHWSVFRIDFISKDEPVGSTDVCTALQVIKRRRFKLRKLDVRMCRASLRRRRRIQYQTFCPAWARCSELVCVFPLRFMYLIL